MKPGYKLNRLLGFVPMPHPDLNVIIVNLHGEDWIWMYEDGEEIAVLQSVLGMAANSDLSLTHYDAGAISHKMRRIASQRRLKTEKEKRQ